MGNRQYKDGYIRPFRVATMRAVTNLEGVDRALHIVSDCFVSGSGDRIYKTPDDVEQAIDSQELEWNDVSEIGLIASELSSPKEKK